jgi:hypothetical protein
VTADVHLLADETKRLLRQFAGHWSCLAAPYMPVVVGSPAPVRGALLRWTSRLQPLTRRAVSVMAVRVYTGSCGATGGESAASASKFE